MLQSLTSGINLHVADPQVWGEYWYVELSILQKIHNKHTLSCQIKNLNCSKLKESLITCFMCLHFKLLKQKFRRNELQEKNELKKQEQVMTKIKHAVRRSCHDILPLLEMLFSKKMTNSIVERRSRISFFQKSSPDEFSAFPIFIYFSIMVSSVKICCNLLRQQTMIQRMQINVRMMIHEQKAKIQ